MFATTKKIKFDDKEILCCDLTYGYIVGVQNGSIEETELTVISNGTNLCEDDILALRSHQVKSLYSTILMLTYPDAYNKDGSLKDDNNDDTSDDKKKA